MTLYHSHRSLTGLTDDGHLDYSDARFLNGSAELNEGMNAKDCTVLCKGSHGSEVYKADWTADLNVDFGISSKDFPIDERKIKDLELIRYEKYDCVLLVCRNEVNY